MNETQLLLFLNMGPMEIVVVLMAVLMLFGAKGIPGIARGLGKGIRQMKDAAAEIQTELKRSAEEMQGDLNVKKELDVLKEDPLKDFNKDDNA